MWKWAIIGTILLAGAGLFGLSRLIWTSPDYSATGVCSARDIDQTYKALADTDSFGKAAMGRASYEFWTYHTHRRSMAMDFVETVNVVYDGYFEKRQTAAYYCSHAFANFRELDTFRTFPKLMGALTPLSRGTLDAERLSVCLYFFEPYSPPPLSQATIDQDREICEDRR